LEVYDWEMIRAQKSYAQILAPLYSDIGHSSYAFLWGIVGYILRVLIWMPGCIVITGIFFCALIHLQLVSNFKSHLEQFDLLLHPNTTVNF